MQNGSYGIGASGVGMTDNDILSPTSAGTTFFNQGGGASNNHFGGYGTGIHLSYGSSGDGSQRMTANLFIDSAGNLSIEWLAVIKSTGAIARQYIQKLYGPLNKPTAADVRAIPFFGGISAGTNLNALTEPGIWYNPANANATLALNYPSTQAGSLQVLQDAGSTQIYTEYSSGSGRQWRRGLYMGKWSAWRVVYDSGNTTIDTNGFIKRASPIVKLFSDGSSELNSESEGVTVSRESVGVYRISGVLGMNSDGAWGGIDGGFEVPTDRNGQRLLWLDYEVEADGSILVKTYHRTYPDSPEFARNVMDGYSAGDPIDIPIDQYLSVRVQMPQDSIFNRAQLEMEQTIADQSNDHEEYQSADHQ